MSHLYTETFGHGQAIVLIHGWAMHCGIWRNFAEALAKNYRVTLVDLPGHGRSEVIEPFTLESVSKALVEVISEANACWLGWSLGAEIVLQVARCYPEKVDKVILLAGTPCFSKKVDWPGMENNVLDGFASSLSADMQATLLRFLSLQIKGEDRQKAAFQALRHLVYEVPPPDLVTLLQGLQILKQADLRPTFAELTVPVAAILAELDTLVPVAIAEKLRDLLPNVDIAIIKRAGHVPFLSHQDEIVKIVSRFMDTHAAE